MAGSIREAMDRAIEERALPAASHAFNFDSVSTFDKFVVPYMPVAGQLADALTTRAGINRGLVEANPLMKGAVKNMPLFFAMKIGLGALVAVSVKKLQDNGRNRSARIASFFGTLAGAGPALLNVRTMR